MENPMVEINPQNLTVETVRKYICPTASDQEIMVFANICKKFNLNPLPAFREVYLVKYGTSPATILTGYETYLKRADRTDKYGGMKAFTEGSIEAKTLKGCVEVYRKDWQKPLYHEVLFEEYAQKKSDGTLNRFWKDKPHTMIKKVAISQAFRLAFPDEFGGLPYTREEMNDIEADKPQIAVEMPKSRAESAKPDKTPENGTTAQIKGIVEEPPIDNSKPDSTVPISEAEGKALLEAAKNNGWEKADVVGYVNTLGYDKLRLLTVWDYEDVLEYFSKNTKSSIRALDK